MPFSHGILDKGRRRPFIHEDVMTDRSLRKVPPDQRAARQRRLFFAV